MNGREKNSAIRKRTREDEASWVSFRPIERETDMMWDRWTDRQAKTVRTNRCEDAEIGCRKR